MKVFQTNEIRNIALIGGAKTGKTTLAEDMLFEGGVINRRGTIEDKNTVSDYRDIEMERQNSVYSSVLYSLYNNHKINIIDTPGFDDFVGEVISALKVVDAAVSIVSAQNGVEPGTETTWRQCAKVNMPVITPISTIPSTSSGKHSVVR
jgi:elongation factor G